MLIVDAQAREKTRKAKGGGLADNGTVIIERPIGAVEFSEGAPPPSTSDDPVERAAREIRRMLVLSRANGREMGLAEAATLVRRQGGVDDPA